MRWLAIIFVIALFAAGGTYVRYQSFDTCRWLVVDTAQTYDLSETAAEARARADMVIHGAFDPDPMDCLHAWWRVRQVS